MGGYSSHNTTKKNLLYIHFKYNLYSMGEVHINMMISERCIKYLQQHLYIPVYMCVCQVEVH